MTVDPVKDGNNWYAYVNADPVNMIDLLGLCSQYAYTPGISDPTSANFDPRAFSYGGNNDWTANGVGSEVDMSLKAKTVVSIIKKKKVSKPGPADLAISIGTNMYDYKVVGSMTEDQFGANLIYDVSRSMAGGGLVYFAGKGGLAIGGPGGAVIGE